MGTMMTNILFLALMILFSGAASAAPAKPVKAVAPPNGAKLYRKHCSACHPDPSRFRTTKDLVSLLRNPPSRMPIFSEGKLSDRDAAAIERFLVPAAPGVAKTAQSGTSAEAPSSAPPVSFIVEPDKPLPLVKISNDPASKTRRFVKSWTIKDLGSGKNTVLQKFGIVVNENNELTVIPSSKLASYALRITAFDIIGNTLKLQFKWKAKNAASYWKIETFQLVLSEATGKLSGSYSLQTIGGQNEKRIVWGE